MQTWHACVLPVDKARTKPGPMLRHGFFHGPFPVTSTFKKRCIGNALQTTTAAKAMKCENVQYKSRDVELTGYFAVDGSNTGVKRVR